MHYSVIPTFKKKCLKYLNKHVNVITYIMLLLQKNLISPKLNFYSLKII